MASQDIEKGGGDEAPLHSQASSSLPSNGNISSNNPEDVHNLPKVVESIPIQEVTAETILSDKMALSPDPGTEHLFEVEKNKFAFSPGQLSKLLNPKSLSAFHALGGIAGLEKGLRSNITSGLSSDEASLDGTVTFEDATGVASSPRKSATKSDGLVTVSTADKVTTRGSGESFADRKRIFRDNRLPEKKSKSLLELAWITYNDKVLILLTIAAVVSLSLGLYQTFGQKHEPGEAKIEWVEGVAIMAAIIIVVVVGTLNDWQKERQFVKLNKKKEDRLVKVIRSGKLQELSVYDVLVGDVMHLEPGDMVPVDGVLIEGHSIKCDESSATGESDLLKKQSGAEVFRAIEAGEDVRKLDPFILSGSKVTEGVGTFLVTAVGVHSTFGKTMMSLREETEATPLQQKLNVLAEYIAKLGGAAALVLFVALFIKFCVQLKGSTQTPSEKGQAFLQIFIVSVTVVVVAVPEGLPLAVTLALAFATTRMLKDNNLVRVLRACETMGNATTVCSDKTGTLTENKMTMVAATVGKEVQYGKRTDLGDDTGNGAKSEVAGDDRDASHSIDKDNVVAVNDFLSQLSTETKGLLAQSIVQNSTAFEGEQDGKQTIIGSKTETALLQFARTYLGIGPLQEERSNANVVQVVPFDSGHKYMASVVRLADDRFRIYAKGASEILLQKCTKIVENPRNADLSGVPLAAEDSAYLAGVISTYASRSLRTIAILYRDFESWPPAGAVSKDDSTQADFHAVFQDMTLLGIVGIQDPLRQGVQDAVKDCQNAGVMVRMVTGDNVLTAKAIAEECGIYTPKTGGVVMEGPVFRRLSQDEMDQTIPHLQVLARSSPDDKRILVKRLKELGETVAVTGDGTNDAPALKMADIGFSMGIAGTEVAKEASAIILMDDNFASIVKALMWGRAVNDAVKKFLQFQLTVNITAVILTFVSAVASATEESVLTAVQLLWVNLIMDTFAALALATDPPTRNILNRKPQKKSAPLITLNMWKMIIGQAIFQLVVTFILNFGGETIFSYHSDHEKDQLRTLVFNTFVWMQIFNEFNNRRLDNKFNIFEGIQHNWFFIAINAIMIGGQVMIVFVGGKAFHVTPLNGPQWGYSLVLGALSLPVAIIIRLIPDEWIANLVPKIWRRKLAPEVVAKKEAKEEAKDELKEKVEDLKRRASRPEDLSFITLVRGGRVRSLKLGLKTVNQTGMMITK
ncbi:calcium-translocating P-type ATPase [Hyaloscypha bicolor E]|uniref:Calcium-transporting ATPase n=1 Tax=Hyaloscypha bicolor E TaxID=1095630 RepID=A0A2J6SJL5_9HELO|nr:calcium-translocating P-type ATPase [Hyaloscypha bicolor E]PMD50959.1 calcium-translocating P-type ATPase [Hyaloscypha bicolor E]